MTDYDREQAAKREAQERERRRQERERCDRCPYQSACKRGFYVAAPSGRAPCRER